MEYFAQCELADYVIKESSIENLEDLMYKQLMCRIIEDVDIELLKTKFKLTKETRDSLMLTFTDSPPIKIHKLTASIEF